MDQEQSPWDSMLASMSPWGATGGALIGSHWGGKEAVLGALMGGLLGQHFGGGQPATEEEGTAAPNVMVPPPRPANLGGTPSMTLPQITGPGGSGGTGVQGEEAQIPPDNYGPPGRPAQAVQPDDVMWPNTGPPGTNRIPPDNYGPPGRPAQAAHPFNVFSQNTGFIPSPWAEGLEPNAYIPGYPHKPKPFQWRKPNYNGVFGTWGGTGLSP